MPPTPFGERLKRERELRGVSLKEVSTATKINTKYLEALETEQWDQLPGGFFNRGFIRTVARFLGLNEDGLISEYALVTKDHPTVTVWVHDLEKPRKPWLPAAAVAAIVAILALGAWMAAKRWGGVAHVEASRDKTAETAPGAPLTQPVATPSQASVAEPAPATTVSPDAQELAARKPQDESAPALPPDSTAANVVAAASNSDASAPPLELRIQAARKARIRVASDGRAQFSGWLTTGETRNFSARDAFQLFVNDSSAVFIELNGTTIAPPGMPGRPGHATITRKDLR